MAGSGNMAGLRKYPADNDCSVAEPAGFRQLNLSPGLVESLFDTACSADRTKVDRVPQTGLFSSFGQTRGCVRCGQL